MAVCIPETQARRIKAQAFADMSELFANLSGFRKPDVRMNQGPLPSVAGGPVGSDGTPDGVINGSDSLLGNISPYAYGESARAGSDSNYQQIPHRAQYIVLPLHLPSQDSTSTHKVSHAVDNGELAFVLMTRGRQWFSPGENVATAGPISLPLFANLAAVNYILACMQLAPLRAAAGQKRTWTAIRSHLWGEKMRKGFDPNKCKAGGAERVQHLFECVQYTMQNLFKPHGICAGSEKQGGQHEESWAPVQAAVNYTTTMTVDGQNRDLLNYWHRLHVCAGDRLLLTLQLVNAGSAKNTPHEYQLTSYYKRPVSATIVSDEPYWTLVPHILHADKPGELLWHDHRLTGYWHIAQSFQGRRGFDTGAAGPGGAPLHVTFAPVFVQCDNGAKETRYFCQDLLDELALVPDNAFALWFAHLRAGMPYDEDALKIVWSQSGVKAGTLKTLFTTHGDYIATLLTRVLDVDNLFVLFWGAYRFAAENHITRMQKRILHHMHGTRFRQWLHKSTRTVGPEMIADNHKIISSILSSSDLDLFKVYMGKWLGILLVNDAADADDGGGSGILQPIDPQNVYADAGAAFGSVTTATMGEDMAAHGDHDVRQKAGGRTTKKKCAVLQPVAE